MHPHPTELEELDDSTFLYSFEAATLDPHTFHHADHVRLAWIHLHRFSLLDAIARFRNGLLQLVTAHGKPDRYHETVTWAMLLLVNERMRLGSGAGSWEEFSRANPDLLDWKGGPFFEYYDPEVLESAEARSVFVLPRPRVGTGRSPERQG